MVRKSTQIGIRSTKRHRSLVMDLWRLARAENRSFSNYAAGVLVDHLREKKENLLEIGIDIEKIQKISNGESDDKNSKK